MGQPGDKSCEQVDAEIEQLRRSNRILERRVEQVLCDADAAQSMSTQSKRAMLRTYDELSATIGRLQTAARELAGAKERAEIASEAKGRFLATMSHEIRTPMNGVLGAVELLLTTELDPEQHELATLMHQSGTALLTLINEVLDYSKIEAGRITLENATFDLPACIHAAVELQQKAAAAKSLPLRVVLAPTLPTMVIGDPTRVRQVLLNLLGNAIKFTPHGHVEIRVEPAPRGADLVLFAVSDTGIGIKQEALSRIFDAFTQEDETTTRRFGGTGLGLGICKHLAELMGGEITVESVVGQGSTFRVVCRLPNATGAAPVTEVAVALRKDARFEGRRVLVVDDVAANRLIATKMLQRLGCIVRCADDGAQALAWLDRERFDAVFLDCSMPVMDGFEAAARIRARTDAVARIKVVAMTAYSMPGDEARCLDAGMDAYVPKPLLGKSVAEVLGRLLPGVSAPSVAR